MTFQPGQLVSLKSHALPMTVESVNGDDIATVRRDLKGNLIRETVKAVALKPYESRRPISMRF